MSRSNHYRICEECTVEELCYLHQPPYYTYPWVWDGDPTADRQTHKPIRFIEGRRSWKRRARYPSYSPKIYHNPPPRWWWHEQHAMVRRVHRQMMLHEEDPALPPEKRLINLWRWY